LQARELGRHAAGSLVLLMWSARRAYLECTATSFAQSAAIFCLCNRPNPFGDYTGRG